MAIHHLASIFGIFGNVVSFLVYLAPIPTFYRIYKRKSTEGFQSIPYSVALFSAMLLLYYALLKTENGLMIITINSVGCAIEATYLTLFIIYATREAKVFTMKLLVLFNVGALGLIIAVTHLSLAGHLRVTVVGWICAVFSLCVFAAPLSIMRLVIRTKSVEYMPFSLSFSLTICAVMWFFYGFLIHDYYIATPNILGFLFGLAQMILYVIYKDRKSQVLPITSVKPQEDESKKVVNLVVLLEMQEKTEPEVTKTEEIKDIEEENEADEKTNKPIESQV